MTNISNKNNICYVFNNHSTITMFDVIMMRILYEKIFGVNIIIDDN